jgi:ribonuclease T2
MKSAVSSLLLIVVALSALALPPRRHKSGDKSPSEFDYYVLSLSWSPSFCASHSDDSSPECKIGNHKTFVLHGLWPQAQSGPPPMECSPARPVSNSIVDSMMRFYPSRGLVQHEWEKHGTCSDLSSADYFHQVEQAFTSVKVPAQFSALNRDQQFDVKQIEESFASANNASKDSFRISCHAGEMVGVDVCLSKDLKYQACSVSARECPTDRILLRAPR